MFPALTRITFAVSTAVVFLAGCSTVPSTKIVYQSQKEVLLETLEEYPREVLLDGGDSVVVAERLAILFEREIKEKPTVTKDSKGEPVAWNAGTQNLIIRISKRLTAQGHLFAVDVTPRTAQFAGDADLAARNIARYIKTGIFERSLYKE